MSIGKKTHLKLAIVFFFSFLVCVYIGSQAGAAWIRGISSNFDLHNFTPVEVNDLELTLGGIGPNDIDGIYDGQGARGWTPQIVPGHGEVTIIWTAPRGEYLNPCEWLHLGLSLRPDAPLITYAMATWTVDGQPVGVVAFVWQNWVGYVNCSVGDIIIPPLVFPVDPRTQEPDVLTVERRWAPSTEIIPLNNLTQRDPMVESLEWSQQTQTDKLGPLSDPSEMLIPPSPDEVQAIIVQYPVTMDSTGEVEAVFTNQAVIEPLPPPTSPWIRGTFSNFDLHNFTDGPVNDLELVLGGIRATDIVKFYAGAHARRWIPLVEEGNRELIIIWKAPDGEYLKPCEWLHLGFALRPGAPPVLYAKATWTRDGEPVGTIAFVWQNWDGDPDSGVIDIIIPPAEFPIDPRTGEPDPLKVERRWALSKEIIPLDNLTQADPMVRDLGWVEDPEVPILEPGSEPSELIIPWPGEEIEAVLVQYTVALTGTIEAVFTNQVRIVHDPSPRPTIIKPAEFHGEKPDLVSGLVRLLATEATGMQDDHIVLTYFLFSRDDGQNWEFIGEDDDGTTPTYGTLPTPDQHNWWQVEWDVSQYFKGDEEGPCLVKAVMIDRYEFEGESVTELYVDPTPPQPILVGIDEHQVFLRESELAVQTLDEDIVSIIWEIQFKLLNYVKGIPYLDQHDYGVGHPNDGNMYCAPTGSAACFKWWADHGFPELTQNGSGNPLTDTQLVEGLATAMGTSGWSGTSGAGIINGLRQWVQDRGLLSLSVTDHATINPTTIRNEVENCKEDVILGILWNTGGGHIVTVDSIANFTNADGTTNIGVMDPWDGEIVNITMEPEDGDVAWPGKAGVHASGLMATVSPIKPIIAIPMPWVVIGEGLTPTWDPAQLRPGLYFLRCTMTDAQGNRSSSQITARVGQPLLPVFLHTVTNVEDCRTELIWEETEPGLGPFVYTVEYADSLEKPDWIPAPGPRWPIKDTSWTSPSTCDLRRRYYRIKKEHEPK